MFRFSSAAIRRTVLALVVAFAPFTAHAVLIDFETTPPGVAPVDDAALPQALPYTNTPGVQVTFGFDTDGVGGVDADAVFEHAGLDAGEPPNGGFAGSTGTDTADPGFTAQLGSYFLRGPVGGATFGTFVIKYASTFTVTDCSGEIWDIDGTGTDNQPGLTEQYRVKAFDAGNNLLATIDSPLGTLSTPFAPLDGQPWTFAFSGLSAGIDHVEITFIGTKTSGIGLAFNNFNPTAIPEPSSACAVVVAASVPALRRRKRYT